VQREGREGAERGAGERRGRSREREIVKKRQGGRGVKKGKEARRGSE